ncbi:Hypothetical protein POVR2_LOCUS235 [uncultured virus]|nr:Hypothetical protein POVR2_LOCUS235 [uncultured virus]
MSYDDVVLYVQSVIQDVEGEILRRSRSYVANCKFTVNMPLRERTRANGYCYLWVTNREVYRMLTGLNYDGRVIGTSKASQCLEGLTPRELLSIIDWADNSISDFGRYNVPAHDEFKFDSVSVTRVSNAYVEGKLFCMTILPDSYPTERLQELFSPFVTHGKLLIYRGRTSATITFSHKDDAYFARCMMKKYTDGNLELSFDYCKAR